jgi:hypothetical protein
VFSKKRSLPPYDYTAQDSDDGRTSSSISSDEEDYDTFLSGELKKRAPPCVTKLID